MSKLVICSVGNDPYDHTAKISSEIVSSESWGDTGGAGLVSYNEHYQSRMKKGVHAWVTIREIDMETGVTKLWLNLKNPEKKRVELNLAAKELKANPVKTVRKRTIDEIIMSQAGVTAPFGGPSLWGTPAPTGSTTPPPAPLQFYDDIVEQSQPEPEGSW